MSNMSEEVGRFTIDARDPGSHARASRLVTAHGEVALPAFFPVATRGAVKMASPDRLRPLGVTGLLMNAFHLHLKPGEDVVEALGGVGRFSGWDGPVVTDSGGFQVFSLPELRTVDDEGVTFASPIDGSTHRFTPEGVIDIQRKLGADVMISLDECVRYPASPAAVEAAMRRTVAWNRRSAARWREGPAFTTEARRHGGEPRQTPEPNRKRSFSVSPCLRGEVGVSSAGRSDQLLFGVVQGGMSRDLRLECASALAELDLPGYAIGGVSVGEGPALMREVLSYTVEALPADRPRYVMGIGTPEDLLDAVAMGADLFDCVMPTRNARGACAFTRGGKVRLRNAAWARSEEPVERGCDCPCCATVSRGHLRHMFVVGEATGPMLVTLHNLRFYSRLMAEAREAILEGRYGAYRRGFLDRYLGEGTT